MELRFSVLARDSRFGKAMRRIRPRFAALTQSFAKIDFESAVHKAVLVGLTDDKGMDFFREVPNSDGFFQILAGCEFVESDSDLTKQVFASLRRAAMACPLSADDGKKVGGLFESLEKTMCE
jgi:hypothetical protein